MMTLNSKILGIVLAGSATLLFVTGCNRAKSLSGVQPKPSPAIATPAPTPQRITVAELAKLRWIEGTWRGTGDVKTPFYERYHFENDSTLVVEGLADEKANKATDVTRFELKDGEFGTSGDSRSVATDLREGSVTFSPVTHARNTFRFQRESENLWTATLTWPATADKPAGQRIYHMERLGPANKQ